MQTLLLKLKSIFYIIRKLNVFKNSNEPKEIKLMTNLKKFGKFTTIDLDKKNKEYQLNPSKIYFLIKGKAFLSCIDEEGKKIIFDILTEGSVLGNLDFLEENENYEDECRFIEPFPKDLLKFYEFERSDFLKFIIENPSFMLMILSDFSNRILRLSKKIEELAFHRLKTRILYTLIQMAKPIGKEARFFKLDFKITHEKLAENTGSARETVSKALAELKNGGFVYYDKNKRMIINLGGKKQIDFNFHTFKKMDPR